jgi:hypothetical protein
VQLTENNTVQRLPAGQKSLVFVKELAHHDPGELTKYQVYRIGSPLGSVEVAVNDMVPSRQVLVEHSQMVSGRSLYRTTACVTTADPEGAAGAVLVTSMLRQSALFSSKVSLASRQTTCGVPRTRASTSVLDRATVPGTCCGNGCVGFHKGPVTVTPPSGDAHEPSEAFKHHL